MVSKKYLISGSGGGKGKSGGIPDPDPDNLFSRGYGRILFALSEGQILFTRPGENPRQKIFLDGVALQNQLGEENFPEASIQWSTGAPGEAILEGFEQPSAQDPVNEKMPHNLSIVRTINDANAISFFVTIRTPQLVFITEKGKRIESGFDYSIEISTDGGPYGPASEDVITGQLLGGAGGPGEYQIRGKTSGVYERTHNFPLPPSTSKVWDVRVTRLTVDNLDGNNSNESFWKTLGVLYPSGVTYPGVAQFSFEARSDSFSSDPTMELEGYGMSEILIPHNYEPFERTYTGSFNGSLVPNWTNNPAWVLYTMLVNSRWGKGVIPGNPGVTEEMIDVFDFYAAAAWNDEIVPDGRGGTEPRFTFNAYIADALPANERIDQICATMMGRIYWDGKRVRLWQDRPSSSVRFYDDTQVITEYDKKGAFKFGGFSYVDTEITGRANYVEASFINTQTWEEDTVFHKDEALIARNGFRKARIEVYGCTSAGQALRAAKWRVYTDNYQAESLTIHVSDQGALARLGDVVTILDRRRGGRRRGGRVRFPSPAGSQTIYIDDPDFALEPGENAVLSLILSSGEKFDSAVTAHSINQFAIADPLPSDLPLHWPWSISSDLLEPQIFKIADISEEAQSYKLLLINEEPAKWSFVEQGLALPVRNTGNLPDPFLPPPPPTNLELSEFLQLLRGTAEAYVQAFWKPPEGYTFLSGYDIEYKFDQETAWRTLGSTSATDTEIGPILETPLTSVRVRSSSRTSLKSSWVTAEIQVQGKVAPPSRVQNFTIKGSSGDRTTQLGWALAPDLDVRVGGRVQIRQTLAVGLDATWESAGILKEVAGSSTGTSVPLLAGTYLAKFIDASGTESIFATVVATTGFEELEVNNVVQELVEEPGWTGGRSVLTVEDEKLKLGLVGGWRTDTDVWRQDTDIWRQDLGGGTGIDFETRYIFANNIRLLEPIKTSISSLLVYKSTKADGRPGSGFARLQISKRLESGIFGDWEDLLPGEALLQDANFAILVGSGAEGDEVEISSAKVVIDAEDREIRRIATTSNADWVTIEFSPPFNQPPSTLLFSIQNGFPAETLRWQNMARGSVQVEVVDGNLQRVSREIEVRVESF